MGDTARLIFRNYLEIRFSRRLRIVPKAGTAVSFEISGKLVTLDAGIMAMKPADRAVKKWKTRAPLPL